MIVRRMNPTDKKKVYEMEYEEWGYGESMESFFRMSDLGEKNGTRYVLVNDEDRVVSSILLVTSHSAHEHIPAPTYGICSVVTDKNYRNLGYANFLIETCISHIRAKEFHSIFFLYSDISTSFYRKLGFRELPTFQQKYPDSICMVSCDSKQFQEIQWLKRYQIPDYFVS